MNTFAFNALLGLVLSGSSLISAAPAPDYYTTSCTSTYCTPTPIPYGESSSSSGYTPVYPPPSSDYNPPSPTPDYNPPSYQSSCTTYDYTTICSTSSDYGTPTYPPPTGGYPVPTGGYYPAPSPPPQYSNNTYIPDTYAKPPCSASICYDYVDKCGQSYGGCTLAPNCGGPATPTFSTPYCSKNYCYPSTTTYTTTYTTTATYTTTDYATVTKKPSYY